MKALGKHLPNLIISSKYWSLAETIAKIFAALMLIFCLLAFVFSDIRSSHQTERAELTLATSLSEAQQHGVKGFWRFEQDQKFSLETSFHASTETRFLVVQKLRAKDIHVLAITQKASKVLEFSRAANGIVIQLANIDALAPKDRIVISGITTAASVPIAYWARHFDADRFDSIFNLKGGLLVGALLAIALFSLSVAIMLRDTNYLLFSAWVIATLRVAMVGGGWDLQWVGLNLAPHTADFWYRTTLAIHPILTLALFGNLILGTAGQRTKAVFAATFFLSVVVAGYAVVTSLQAAAPIIWASSIWAICLMLYCSIKKLPHDQSLTTRYYVGGWFVLLGGLAAEVALAAGIIPTSISPLLNSQTSAFVAVLLTACALAERINTEKDKRISAQDGELLALSSVRSTYEQSPAGLATFDADGILLQANLSFYGLFSDAGIEGETLSSIVGEENVAILKSTNSWVEFKAKSSSTDVVWMRARSTNRDHCLELVFVDISAQKIAEEKLKAAANRDQLTNLFNRFKMIELLEQRLASSDCSPTSTDCIAMIDIDSFDRVITNFGHGIGDEVLLAYCDRIQRLLPSTATLGRLSADTMLVLMPCTPIDEASYLIQRILNYFHDSPFEAKTLTVAIKVSAGVSVVESKKSKEVLAACDSALQDAKAKGGGQLVAYGERDTAWLAHKAMQELMAEFSQSIPFDRFELVLQPIVTLHKAKDNVCYEALIRMKNKDGKAVFPDAFLPALEKIGLMSQLDRWVVRQVLEFLERESQHFSRLTCASINLSGASINDERFTDELLLLASKNPKLMSKICFEITENIALADVEATRRFTQCLRTIGARIALDDFGAGYSSFSYIAQLKVETIKIDGSLIKNIDADLAKQAVVKTIVDLGKALGSEVVAEWVETPKILTTLLRLGITAGQGWALSKPVSMAAMASAEHGASFITDESVNAILGIKQTESVVAT